MTQVKRVSEFFHEPTATWYAGYLAKAFQPARATNNLVEAETYDHMRYCFNDLFTLLLSEQAVDKFVPPSQRIRYFLKKCLYIGRGMGKLQLRANLHEVLTVVRQVKGLLLNEEYEEAIEHLKTIDSIQLDDLTRN